MLVGKLRLNNLQSNGHFRLIDFLVACFLWVSCTFFHYLNDEPSIILACDTVLFLILPDQLPTLSEDTKSVKFLGWQYMEFLA